MVDRVRLTQRMVSRLKPPKNGEHWMMDSEVSGLGVRVRSSGRAVYGIRYKDRHGKDRKITLGDTKAMRLDLARETALERLAEVVRGHDPVAMKRKARARATTVRDLGDETLDHLRSQGRSETYLRDCSTNLAKYINPAIGDQEVREATPRQIERLVRNLKDRPRTGNLVRAMVSRMFKLAVRWGYRPDDPTMGVERFPEHP